MAARIAIKGALCITLLDLKTMGFVSVPSLEGALKRAFIRAHTSRPLYNLA
jgi:alpha-D-ribose 1-methylphosphonate 5-triphosphate synthase subunit PhnH